MEGTKKSKVFDSSKTKGFSGNKNKKIIAVDLGGTYLRISLIQNNKILKYIKKKTPKIKDALLKELFSTIGELTEKNKGIKGIGVSCAGPLEPKTGIIKNPPNLPLRNFNLKKALQNKFKKKVEIENDANCVALAEAKFGSGKGKKNLIVLTLGTGIGGGIIIDGKLYNGGNYAGELGHIILDNGKDFEALWKEKKQNIKKLFEQKNKKQLDKTAKYLGQGIASLINIFDPEIVILSGGVKETGSVFLNIIKNNVNKYQIIPRKVQIKWTRLKHPGTLGASLLIK